MRWLDLGLRRIWSSCGARIWGSSRSTGGRELGYQYIEPMVHTGWELLSEVHYFHSFSMEEDPLLLKEVCDEAGLKVSSVSGHSPLMKPEAAVDRLTRAIVLADFSNARFVNTDEMVKPDWMDDQFAHKAMKYSLTRAEQVARRHETTSASSRTGLYETSAGLRKIVDLVPSPWIGVNWDTGNSYLAAAEDPYESLIAVRDLVTSMPGHQLETAKKSAAGDRHASRVRLWRGSR